MDDADRRSGAPSARVMKVIKSDAASELASERPAARASRGVLNAAEFDARTSAQKIVEDARRQAEEILAEAEQQKQEVFARAREEARQEVMAQATAELAKAKMQAGQILASSEGAVVQLALRVAEKVIGQDLQRDPQVVLDICATALEQVRNARSMVMRVNPRDGAVLREKRPKLMERVARAIDISIKDDSDVEPGGCIIQTEFGTVDAQLRTQFEMLRQVLVPDPAKKEGPK